MSALSGFVYGIFDHTGVFFLMAIVLLFISIKQLSKIISRILIGNTQANFEKFVFHNRYKSFGWGVIITSLVQSSSVTTSLIVPLVATQKLKLQKAYPFILGANIGTTITAMLAALFKSSAAINLAVTHLLFNLIAVLVFLFVPGINKMPYLLAGWIGEQCEKRRVISVLFMIVTFFLIPFAFIYLSK
jgi:sodium-dependent phosphate cotransporter